MIDRRALYRFRQRLWIAVNAISSPFSAKLTAAKTGQIVRSSGNKSLHLFALRFSVGVLAWRLRC